MGSCDCSFSLVSTNSQALVLSYKTIPWTSPLHDSCWLTGPLLVCHTNSALSSLLLSSCSHCRSYLGLILKTFVRSGSDTFRFDYGHRHGVIGRTYILHAEELAAIIYNSWRTDCLCCVDSVRSPKLCNFAHTFYMAILKPPKYGDSK